MSDSVNEEQPPAGELGLIEWLKHPPVPFTLQRNDAGDLYNALSYGQAEDGHIAIRSGKGETPFEALEALRQHQLSMPVVYRKVDDA